MQTKLFRQLGLLFVAFWLLLLFAADYWIRNALGSAPPPASLSSVRLALWTTAALFLVLVAVPVFLYLRRLLRGIRDLEEFSSRVAEQHFHLFSGLESHRELSGLARALNDVATQYDRTIRLLTDERNRSDTILRSMIEGVAVIEPGHKIAFSNDAFCQALGLKGLPCAGRLLVEVTRESGLLDLVQRALALGASPGEAQQQTVSAELEIGSSPPRTFAITAAPLAGSSAAVVLVLHDITDLRKLERTRRDFVANVSHEFKTPLTAIQGFTETLLGGALEDPRHSRRFLEIIRDHSVRLSRVTNDLLKLSSIEAGKLELDLQPLDAAELIAECLEMDRLKAAQKQIHLSAHCPGDLPLIRADSARLREALLNLLDNAIQYTPSGGRVEVRASARDSTVTIAVSDTGLGIPAADQKRIFERFYRVDDARSREIGGTGLGLSITKHLVEAHGGRIELASDPGRGSTFSIHLPAA